jgi:hypothetical protein
MTTLDFKLDKSSLEEDLACSPANANPAALEETYFVMPVSFVVDGTDVLALPGRSTHELPVLGFAADTLRALEQLKPGEEKNLFLAGGGELRVRFDGRGFDISCSLNGHSVHVARDELISAFRSFAGKVKAMLVVRVPEIQTHEMWRRWFPE